MGNICDPHADNTTINLQDHSSNENDDPGKKQAELHKNDNTAGNLSNNHAKNQLDNPKSGKPEKSEKKPDDSTTANQQGNDKAVVEPQLDSHKSGKPEKLEKANQDDSSRGNQKENDKAPVEHSETKPCETQKPVEEQKENLVASTQESIQSSSSSIIIAAGAQIEKVQEVNKDVDEEEVVVLEYVVPQERNNVDVQKTARVDNSKTQKEISPPIPVKHEQENMNIIKDMGQTHEAERSCFENNLLAEKKPTVEHNKAAVKNSEQVTPSKGNVTPSKGNVTPSKDNTDNKDENLKEQSLLNEEAEFHRLENEISEKKKLVAKQNETLTRISKNKLERAKDLKNLENRCATVMLQNELKERAFIVASKGTEEKSSRTLTLNEGKLFKFGKGGLTNPKEKWVQLRRYPTGQVVLDYAELFLSAKLERNQITAVERGEKYLSGDSNSFNGRVFAVRTTSTGKHRHMVFAVESRELCGQWIESIQSAFN